MIPSNFAYPLVSTQAPRKRYHIYLDESSQSGPRFMVLGALVLLQDQAESLSAKLQQFRELNRLDQEIKWGKVSGSRVGDYATYIRLVITALRQATPSYYALVIDTSQLDHRRYNGGDREIGFSKFVYQLLMKCARLHCADGSAIDCFLDDRVTRQTLTEFRKILNNGASQKCSVRPFRRVEYRDSKDCNLIQAVDLLTGAIAYHWNDGPRQEGASPNRVHLANQIANQVGLRSLATATPAGRDSFSIWKFAAGPRGVPRRA